MPTSGIEDENTLYAANQYLRRACELLDALVDGGGGGTPGGATEAKQDDIIAELQDILTQSAKEGKQDVIITEIQNVVTALASQATEAKQDAIITELQNIATSVQQPPSQEAASTSAERGVATYLAKYGVEANAEEITYTTGALGTTLVSTIELHLLADASVDPFVTPVLTIAFTYDANENVTAVRRY